ncbi:MAG: PKD domain-containing protein, partial [Saprospiraceae bacterium]|nr:PKD domain-containing protein [Saprospiraceae bacterium]
TDDNGCTATDQVSITIHGNPVVSASAAASSCNDAPITLSATGVPGTGTITGYAWSGPNGFSSSVEDPTIPVGDPSYPGAGVATYTVTVTDDNGCTATDQVSITINAVPTVTASSTPSVCEDVAIDLNATGVAGTGTITGYAWSGPFGFTSSSEDPTIDPGAAAYPTPGIHTYTVTVTDNLGCTNTATVQVEVWDNPEVSAVSATEVCNASTISLDATGTAGSGTITGYAWSGPNGFTSSLEDPVINAGDAAWPGVGTHTYNVTVTDDNGCTGTDQVQVVVNALPGVTATAASAVCGDQPIALNATGVANGGAITGYAWSGPFGFTSSIEDPTINPGDAAYPTAGTHTYVVTITDDNGCTNTSSVNVTVYDNPGVTASAASELCGDQVIALDATGTAGTGTITGYAWNGPNGFTSSVEDPTINPGSGTHPGAGLHTYTVTVTDDNGCTATDQVSITIHGNPVVSASAAASSCNDAPITLSATGVPGTGTITGYAWSGPNGFSSSVEDPTIPVGDPSYPGAGVATYTVTVTDDNGCTATDQVSITINAVPTV